MRRPLLALVLFLLAIAFPLIGEAGGDNLLFILDVSGSMAQSLGKETRIQAAKRVFSELVEKLPRTLNTGLEVYGHYGEKDCSAIEVMVPPQPVDAAKLQKSVEPLEARKGATPIADALATAWETLRPLSGKRTIVLISDGEETCGGNPVATAERIRREGGDVIIHVVGLAVSDKERAQLESIAGAGKGNYYQAGDVTALAESLKKIREEVAAAPQDKVLVKDGFDEDYLAEHWEIKNPNPDAIIVEDGFLQILTDLPQETLFEPTNLVLLKKELPKQYEVILRMRHTLMDDLYDWYKAQLSGLMLYRDKNNGIMLAVGDKDYYGGAQQVVHFVKVRQGKWVPGFTFNLGGAKEEREIVLRLQRIKRKFIASFLNEKGKWQKIGEFTELRPKYKLGIFALRGSGEAREALEMFDEFTLKEIK